MRAIGDVLLVAWGGVFRIVQIEERSGAGIGPSGGGIDLIRRGILVGWVRLGRVVHDVGRFDPGEGWESVWCRFGIGWG